MKRTFVLTTLIVIGAAALGYGVGTRSAPKYPWEAELIPDATTVLASTFVGSFQTEATCRSAATDALAAFGADRGAYLCGRDCNGDPTSAQGRVCAERVEGKVAGKAEHGGTGAESLRPSSPS